MSKLWRGVIEEYRDWLPVTATTPVVTLGEGGTPLVESGWLSQLTGCQVYVKVEGSNPTGSFKDRGMTVAISKAAESGVKAVVCASTGNTSASAAAYAQRAGINPVVLVPEGKIAAAKLAQAVLYGAQIVQVQGNFDACLGSPAILPMTTRWRWSTPPTRTASGWPGRRRPLSRSSTRWATHPTYTSSPSATPATCRPIGPATRSTPRPGSPCAARGCGASRRLVRRQSCWVRPSSTRRPWRRPSA